MSSLALFLTVATTQGFLIFWDEFYFHQRRRLPKWERIGHPVDTFSVILPFIYMGFMPYTGSTPKLLFLIMLFSCGLISKDEWVHAKLAPATEHWVHSILFVVHPLLFITAWMLWREQGPILVLKLQLLILSTFLVYQIFYWNFYTHNLPAEDSKIDRTEVDNDLYHDLGERWYEAKDDPVALLRAEAKTKNPWVVNAIQKHFQNGAHSIHLTDLKVLDVGCGAGFLANDLAKSGLQVSGVDLSESSLKVAANHDDTKSVHYLVADAYQLPFADSSFDAVTCMDFLEHVDQPAAVIAEISRVLKPSGIFVFHTFNRNPIAHFVIIKGMEWFVKNTPPHLHIIRLFVKPSELKEYCVRANLRVTQMNGIAPKLTRAFFTLLATGIVPDSFQFRITNSTLLSYLGQATKGGLKTES
jgi:2-polyprenyl-6-hydroxyphenyl methylase/3-demethylubiquinone-9 3-methyltransferase